jgi:hypothetical protein
MLCTETTDVDLKGKTAVCERALQGVYGFRTEKSEQVAGFPVGLIGVPVFNRLGVKKRGVSHGLLEGSFPLVISCTFPLVSLPVLSF